MGRRAVRDGQRRGVSPPGNSPDVQQQPALGDHEVAPQPEFLSVPILCREARKLVVEMDLPISGSRTRKLVRQFVRGDHRNLDDDFLPWFLRYVLTYADPTGETARKRLDRQRSQ
jgi:hypothetical protein